MANDELGEVHIKLDELQRQMAEVELLRQRVAKLEEALRARTRERNDRTRFASLTCDVVVRLGDLLARLGRLARDLPTAEVETLTTLMEGVESSISHQLRPLFYEIRRGLEQQRADKTSAAIDPGDPL